MKNTYIDGTTDDLFAKKRSADNPSPEIFDFKHGWKDEQGRKGINYTIYIWT